MNRIDILHGQGGNGRQTFLHLQEAIKDAFSMVLSDYTAANVAMKITGVAVTETVVGSTTTVAITDGVAALNGEYFRVAAQTIDRTAAEVAWLAPEETFVDQTPMVNTDGVGTGNQVQRVLILFKDNNYPAVGQYVPLDAPTQQSILEAKLSSRFVRKGYMMPIDTDDIPLIPGNWDNTGLGLSGTPAEGLAICNGLNGTIDLRHLAPIGATLSAYSTGAPGMASGVNSGAVYAPEDVVGSHEHTLTELEMPVHTHEGQVDQTAGSGDTHYARPNGAPGASPSAVVGDAGGGQPHNNMQPSKALVWVKVIA